MNRRKLFTLLGLGSIGTFIGFKLPILKNNQYFLDGISYKAGDIVRWNYDCASHLLKWQIKKIDHISNCVTFVRLDHNSCYTYGPVSCLGHSFSHYDSKKPLKSTHDAFKSANIDMRSLI